MKIGIYPGMPEADYRSAPGICQTNLKLVRYGLQVYRDSVQIHDDEDDESTGSMRLGSLLHAAEANITSFLSRHVVLGKGETKTGSAYRQACSVVGPENVLSFHEYRKVMAMRQSLERVPEYQMATENCDRECAWFCQDQETSLQLKGLIDIRPKAGIALADIKTIRPGRIDAAAFASEAEERGYDIQAAFYLDGYRQAGGDVRTQFWFFVVENAEPFRARAFVVADDWIKEAEARYRGWLRRVAEAEVTGNWITTTPAEVIRRPAWARS